MNIYIWNAKKLVEELRKGVTTEVEKMRYLVILTLIYTLVSYDTIFTGEAYTLMYTIDWLAFSTISILGIFWCFRQNSKGDNVDFITRFTCLALPVSVRLFVYSIPFIIVFYGVFTVEQISGFSTVAEVVLFSLLNVVFYYLLGSYIAVVAKPDMSN